MSSTIVRCPGCGKSNRLPDAAGKTVVCGHCRTPLRASQGPVTLDDASFSQRASETSAMVVDFWAPWCGPCRVIAPVIERLAASTPGVVFAKVNVDENPGTAGRFGVQGIPTLVFLANGEEKGRLVGAADEARIRDSVERYLR